MFNRFNFKNMKTTKNKIDNQKELFGKFWLSVKAVVVNETEGKVLVLKRSKKEKFHKGAYDLPGGHMDKNETVAECLQREVKEETGLEIRVGDVLAVREYPKNHKMFNKIKALRYITYYQRGEVKLSKEHSKFEWLTFEEVKNKLADDGYEQEKKETILQAQKYLEDHNSVEKWQRAIADFENYKKQTAKQNEEFRKYATENVVVEILPVLDNFQSALDNIPEEEQGSGWVTGMTYIQKQLLDVLNNYGVEKMEVKVGDEFDANLHEAIKAQGQDTSNKKQKTKKKKDKNVVIAKIIKNGYKIGDKIIRPAMVETN